MFTFKLEYYQDILTTSYHTCVHHHLSLIFHSQFLRISYQRINYVIHSGEWESLSDPCHLLFLFGFRRRSRLECRGSHLLRGWTPGSLRGSLVGTSIYSTQRNQQVFHLFIDFQIHPHKYFIWKLVKQVWMFHFL